MAEPAASSRAVLVRHGATEWSESGRHTGRSDVPLTERGRAQAALLADALAGWDFALVLTSPLSRAAETCALAGLGDAAVVDEDLVEWDYGDYEGLRTAEIRESRPGWTVWNGGVPHGESVEAVGTRADAVIARIRAAGGDVAVFAHAHLLRVLGARWTGLPPDGGRLLGLDPATLSVVGWEREAPIISRWNAPLE